MKAKKLLYLAMVICLPGGVKAQQANNGIYQLKQLCGEDGVYKPAPTEIDQYKICEDHSMFFLTTWGQLNDLTTQIRFSIRREAKAPNANDVKDSESKEVRVTDVTKNAFKLKWFNNLSNYTLFPRGTWVTEEWHRQSFTSTPKAIWETMAMQDFEKSDNKLLGLWKYAGTIKKQGYGDSYDYTPTSGDFYKIYGKDFSIMFSEYKPLAWMDGFSLVGDIRTVKYYAEDATRENNNPCIIQWIGNEFIQVTYISEEKKETINEIWQRVEMDSEVRNLFANALKSK